MARPKSDTKIKTEQKQAEQKPVTRPPRAKTTAQKVEELRLGKFAKCEPLHMPEKEVRRGWQIVGAVALMLMAIVGVYALLMLDFSKGLRWGEHGPVPFTELKIYEMVMMVSVAIATLMCMIMSVIMLVKKRVPVGFWYVLIVAATVAVMCASFRSFRYYEIQGCFKRATCEAAEGELIWISMRNLLIYTLGLVAFFGAWKVARLRAGWKRKK